jgi:hypothetical protein
MLVVVGACLVLASTSFAQGGQTTSTEVKAFEVISVDGNQVVLRGAAGNSQEFTVPDTFRFQVGGKEISVRELKPGMKGMATVTTITTVKPVSVTEVRNGEVFNATGGTVIIRGPKGFQSFTEGDVQRRNVRILRDGQPIRFSDLRTGDRLTATIVTEKPPEILTERQVKAKLAEVAGAVESAAAAPARAAAPPPPPPPTPAAAGQVAQATTPARTLPRTAGPLPLLAVVGLASLALGTALRLRRRNR